jgi:hypothetical protein
MDRSSFPKGGFVPDELLEIEATDSSSPPAEALDALLLDPRTSL